MSSPRRSPAHEGRQGRARAAPTYCDSLRAHRPPARIADASEGRVIRELFETFFELGPTLAVSRVAVGRTNCNFLVDTASRRFVARAAPSRNPARLRREGCVLQALAKTPVAFRIPAVVTPRNVATPWVSFAGREWLVLGFCDGFNAKPPRGAAPAPAIVLEIGAAIGGLGESLSTVLRNLEPPFDHKVHLGEVVNAFESICRHPLDAPAAIGRNRAERLKRRIEPLKRLLSEARFDAAIHGDIRFANLIFDRRCSVRTMLDFDRVGFAPRLLEHALAVRNLLMRESTDPRTAGLISFQAAAAYARGYKSVTGREPFDPHSRNFLSYLEIAALEELHFVLLHEEDLRDERREALATTAWRLFRRAGSREPWSR